MFFVCNIIYFNYILNLYKNISNLFLKFPFLNKDILILGWYCKKKKLSDLLLLFLYYDLAKRCYCIFFE